MGYTRGVGLIGTYGGSVESRARLRQKCHGGGRPFGAMRLWILKSLIKDYKLNNGT